MASFAYQNGLHEIGASGLLDIVAQNDLGNIKLALATDAYIPDQVAHQFYSDLTNEVISGGGYVAGGMAYTASSITVNRDDGILSDLIKAAIAVNWPASTITAAYAITYYDTGSPSSSPLLFLGDFGGSRISNSTDFVVSWANDILHTFGPCPVA